MLSKLFSGILLLTNLDTSTVFQIEKLSSNRILKYPIVMFSL